MDFFNYNILPSDFILNHYTVSRFDEITTLCDWKVTRENYRYCVLHYIIDGEGHLTVNSSAYELQAGDLFILGPGESHSYACDSPHGFDLLWIEFFGANSREIFSELQKNDIRIIKPPYNEDTVCCMKEIATYINENVILENDKLYTASHMVYKMICSLIIASKSMNRTEGPLPNFINTVLEYIRLHLSHPLDITFLANLSNKSYSEFCKIFKKHIGCSPKKYVNIQKINKACDMLEHDCYIDEISEKLSFCDTSYFVKVFKNHNGITPYQYKLNFTKGVTMHKIEDFKESNRLYMSRNRNID